MELLPWTALDTTIISRSVYGDLYISIPYLQFSKIHSTMQWTEVNSAVGVGKLQVKDCIFIQC